MKYLGRTGRSSSNHLHNQGELDDLIHDLGLTKSGSELLTSRMQEWHLLDKVRRSTVYRNRHLEFSTYCGMDKGLFYLQ